MHITLWVSIGGLERLIVEMARKMDKGTFDIQVLCLTGYDPVFKAMLDTEGVPLHLIQRKSRFDLSFFLKIVRLLKKKRIDVVHVHSGCFFNAAVSKAAAGVSGSLYTAHGMPLRSDFKSRLEDRIAGRLMDRLVSVSEEIQDYQRNEFSSQIKKMSLIINGVDTDLFKPIPDPTLIRSERAEKSLPPDKFIIGSVGRLDKIKNYACLIKAISVLATTYQKQPHLVLIGNGDERNKLEKLAESLDLKEHVTFLGIRYDVNDLLPLMDIFALSSITEGTSVSLLEAQSCGIPAVVTDVGGNSNIIRPNENGFLCLPDNHEDLADKIAFMIDHRKKASEMGRKARVRIKQHFSLSSMIRQYERLYMELANGRASNELKKACRPCSKM